MFKLCKKMPSLGLGSTKWGLISTNTQISRKKSDKKKKVVKKRKRRGTYAPAVPMRKGERLAESDLFEERSSLVVGEEGEEISESEAGEREGGYNPGVGMTSEQISELLKDVHFEKTVENVPKEEDAAFFAEYVRADMPDRLQMLEIDKREILNPSGPIVYAEEEGEDKKESVMGDDPRLAFLPRHTRKMVKTHLRNIYWDQKLDMYAHDALVPSHLQKYFLDPYGIHNRRDAKAAKRAEREKRREDKEALQEEQPVYRKGLQTEGPSIRQLRVAQLLWEAAQEVVVNDFKSDKLGGLVIRKVRVTRNLEYAKLFWTCNPIFYQKVSLFLNKASKLFRFFLTKRVLYVQFPKKNPRTKIYIITRK